MNSQLLKLRGWVKAQLRFDVYELVLGGIWIGLWAASATPIFNFNLGFMRIGVTYVWPILMGLTLRPVFGVFLAIIGDNIALLTSGTGFSQWMPEYAVIYPFIVLLAAASRYFLLHRGLKSAMLTCLVINLVALTGLLIVLILQSRFSNNSRNDDSFFNFTSTASRVVIWVMFTLITSVTVALGALSLVKSKRIWLVEHQKQIRRYWALISLVFGIIVLTIWLWGPFAQIRYLSVWVNPSTNYYAQYDLFLIPRILKTPISLALYVGIIAPLYAAHIQIARHRASAARWSVS